MKRSVLFLLVFVACSDPTVGPTQPDVETSLTISPVVVAPGDSVHFDVSAVNQGEHDVALSELCGTVFDVLITGPDGAQHSVIGDLLGDHGAFTCEWTERFVAEPMEAESEQLTWVAPTQLGTYEAIGGLRWHTGLRNLTESVVFRVR